jgi:uncharacterized protein YbjQ (UPF0145 family)
MAECVECGKSMGFADKVNAKSYDGKCIGCTKALQDNHGKSKEDLEVIKTQVAADEQKEAAINSIVLTTAHTLQDVTVTKYLGVVSAECAYGMNMFKDMFANVRNLVGGRSAAVEDTMRDSRETVMQELKREAHAKGANAVIAVDLDYTQLGAGGNMMVLVSASGTAVVIEE